MSVGILNKLNFIIMKTIKRYLLTLIGILLGMILSSLWIVHDDSWKILLPIILFLLTFNMMWNEINK